jgi:hypothetical protein
MDFSDKDEKHSVPSDNATEVRSAGIQDVNEGEMVTAGSQHLHRKLRGKEVQLFAVGGAIGTCMYSARMRWEYICWLIVPIQRSSCRWELSCPKAARQASFLAFLLMDQSSWPSMNASVSPPLERPDGMTEG